MKYVQSISPMQLFLIKEIDNAWWNMQNGEGKVGLVPKDYLQPTRPQPEPPDEELDPKVQALIGMQLDNSSFYGLNVFTIQVIKIPYTKLCRKGLFNLEKLLWFSCMQ